MWGGRATVGCNAVVLRMGAWKWDGMGGGGGVGDDGCVTPLGLRQCGGTCVVEWECRAGL